MKTKLTFSVTVEVDENHGSIGEQQHNIAAVLRQAMIHLPTTVRPCAAGDFESVQLFHQKYELPRAKVPSLLGGEMLDFRIKFMQEEFEEFIVASEVGDLLGAADALVDLSYVTLGTADIMCLPWPSLWDEVQCANMAKVRAARAGDSKRGTTFDVVKPEGWTAPDHAPVLGSGPWPTFNPASTPSEDAPKQAGRPRQYDTLQGAE